MSNTLPPDVSQYFWGDDLSQLSWENHRKYITQTLLEKGDTPAIKWLFEQTTKEEIKKILPMLKLTPKSSNFWTHYLS